MFVIVYSSAQYRQRQAVAMQWCLWCVWFTRISEHSVELLNTDSGARFKCS